MNTKKDLQQQVRVLKTSENKARDAIGTTIGSLNPFAKKDVLDSIVPGKDKVGKVGKVFEKINKEGLMNMGVDKAKGMFDNIKIDPQALLKA